MTSLASFTFRCLPISPLSLMAGPPLDLTPVFLAFGYSSFSFYHSIILPLALRFPCMLPKHISALVPIPQASRDSPHLSKEPMLFHSASNCMYLGLSQLFHSYVLNKPVSNLYILFSLLPSYPPSPHPVLSKTTHSTHPHSPLRSLLTLGFKGGCERVLSCLKS